MTSPESQIPINLKRKIIRLEINQRILQKTLVKTPIIIEKETILVLLEEKIAKEGSFKTIYKK